MEVLLGCLPRLDDTAEDGMFYCFCINAMIQCQPYCGLHMLQDYWQPCLMTLPIMQGQVLLRHV